MGRVQKSIISDRKKKVIRRKPYGIFHQAMKENVGTANVRPIAVSFITAGDEEERLLLDR